MTYAASFDRGCESMFESFNNECTGADGVEAHVPQRRPLEPHPASRDA